MISQAFADTLEKNRARFNALFAEARWRNAALDGDAILAFLGTGVARGAGALPGGGAGGVRATAAGVGARGVGPAAGCAHWTGGLDSAVDGGPVAGAGDAGGAGARA